MALNQTALTALAAESGLDLFERVWGRMDRFEAVRALAANSLCTGTPTVPEGHTAESALSWLDWNNGDGSYVNTSPYRYSGGVLSAKPYSVRASLKTAFNGNRSGFLAAATNDDDGRSIELVRRVPPGATVLPKAPTKLFFWTKADFETALAAYPTIDDRANTIKPLPVFYGINGSAWNAFDIDYVADYLESQPEGRRWILCGDYGPYESTGAGALWGKPVDIGGSKRYALADGEHTSLTRKGPSLAIWGGWIVDPSSGWYQFFEQLLAQGAARFGAANATKILDGVVTDIERVKSFVSYKGTTGDSLTQVMGDSYWSTWRTTILKPVLDQAVWDTYDSWNHQTDERCFTFDAAAEAHYVANLNLLADVVRLFFPAPTTQVIDYDARRRAPGTFYIDPAYARHGSPYGTGGPLEESSSANMYGSWAAFRYSPVTQNTQQPTGNVVGTTLVNTTDDQITLTTNPWANGKRVKLSAATDGSGNYLTPGGTTAWTSYYLRSVSGSIVTFHASQADALSGANVINLTSAGTSPIVWDAAKDEWNCFLDRCARRRDALACNRDDVHPWISGENMALNVIPPRVGVSGLWSELVLRAAMVTNGEVGFYAPIVEGGTTLDHKRFVELVEEADEVFGFAAFAAPGLPISYDDPFSVDQVWAGHRTIYRVTPSIQLTTSVSTAGGNVAFSNSGGTLTIAKARVHPASQSALAPLGYWVEQFDPVRGATFNPLDGHVGQVGLVEGTIG